MRAIELSKSQIGRDLQARRDVSRILAGASHRITAFLNRSSSAFALVMFRHRGFSALPVRTSNRNRRNINELVRSKDRTRARTIPCAGKIPRGAWRKWKCHECN
jgi:hypothetical protein